MESNLKRGLSECPTCRASAKRPYPPWLARRLTDAKQRCENPEKPKYDLYGGRGIRFSFPSVHEAAMYIFENFSPLDRTLTIDRIDSNGDYAPGNIRMVPLTENQANRRSTLLSEFDQKYWPYSSGVVRKMLSQGLTREEIISRARLAVKNRYKNWRGIEERLRSMIFDLPDHVIVLPYRGS